MQFHDKTPYVWMGILPLKKRVNCDKCSFATKQRMFGVFAIDEILRYRGNRFPGSRTLCHPVYDYYVASLLLILQSQIGSHVLAYSNSCVNPILYAYFSTPFREAFIKLFFRKRTTNTRLWYIRTEKFSCVPSQRDFFCSFSWKYLLNVSWTSFCPACFYKSMSWHQFSQS